MLNFQAKPGPARLRGSVNRGTCQCRGWQLSFEHMFESTSPAEPAPTNTARVLAPEGEPTEFLYKGRRFHVHAIVSRWRESGGWWNRIADGNNHLNESNIFDDGARAIWRVEAAPEGTLTTFEIERDEITGTWLIRPTSRPL